MNQSISINRFGREFRQIIWLSLPLIASQLVQSSSGFIGTVIIGRLGTDALAASALVSMLWLALFVLFFGALNSVSILVAQCVGAERHRDVSKILVQGCYWTIILSIPVILLMWNEPWLLHLIHQPPATIALATAYVHSLAYCILPLGFLVLIEQYLIGLAKTQLVLWISIIQVPCEIFINYALTFGKFGFPRCGIAGLGYGFTLVFVVAVAIILIYMTRSNIGKQYPFFKYLNRFDRDYFKEIMKVGWPIGVMYGSEVAFFAVIAFMMAAFGKASLAAHQLVIQYFGISIVAAFAICQAAGVRIGNAVGRFDKESIYYAYFASLLFGLLIMIVVGLLYVGIPRPLIAIDFKQHLSMHNDIVRNAVVFLAILAFFQICDNFRLVTIGALRGLKDTRTPLWISLMSFWVVALIFAWLLGFVLHLAGAGLWWAIVIGDIVGASLLMVRFFKRMRTIDLVKLVNIG